MHLTVTVCGIPTVNENGEIKKKKKKFVLIFMIFINNNNLGTHYNFRSEILYGRSVCVQNKYLPKLC